MEWTEIAPFIAVLGVLIAMWWRLNQHIDSRIDALKVEFDAKFDRLDAKFDALHKLLTDNLIALNRDIGELKGAQSQGTPVAD